MQSENKRIAVNTIALYLRSIFTMAIGIFTSRVFLQTLGVENVGIYNVVGGLVSMFSVISTTMSVACSRFLAIALGSGNMDELKRHFSIAMSIHVMFALIVIGVAELIGVWYLNTYMNIAPERLYAANWVFQLSLLTFGINMISGPYNMVINIHEHMKTFAYMSIFDVSMKLLILYILLFINYDRLITYAVLILCVSVINRMIYTIYCHHHFEETHNFKINLRLSTMKEQFGFAGWNSLGIFSGFLRNYGTDLLLNLFFGVTVNAARGVANQIQNAVYGFVTNFLSAINPQIMKSFGAQDITRCLYLVKQGTKFSFYLLGILSMPFIIMANEILQVWLTVIPDYSAIFIQLSFIYLLLDCLSRLVIVAINANGEIRNYQIIVSCIKLLVLPITFMYIYFFEGSPISALIVNIFIEFICLWLRLYFAKDILGIKIQSFVSSIICRCWFVLSIAYIVPFALYHLNYPIIWLKILIISLSCFVWGSISVLFLGMNNRERKTIIDFIKKKIKK